MLSGAFAGLFFALSVACLALTSPFFFSKGIPSGDSGEFVALTISDSRGLAHPPGYPLEVFLRRLLFRLTVSSFATGKDDPRTACADEMLAGKTGGGGDVAACQLLFRHVSFMSLSCVVVAAFVTCAAILMGLDDHAKSLPPWLRWVIALAFVLSATSCCPVLRYASETEVFALNQLLVALGCFLFVSSSRISRPTMFFFSGIYIGCCAMHQHAIAFVAAPPAIMFLLKCAVELRSSVDVFLLLARDLVLGMLSAAATVLAIAWLLILPTQDPGNAARSFGWRIASRSGGRRASDFLNIIELLRELLGRGYYAASPGATSTGMFSSTSCGLDGLISVSGTKDRALAHTMWIWSLMKIPILVASAFLVLFLSRRPILSSSFFIGVTLILGTAGAILLQAGFSSVDPTALRHETNNIMMHVTERFWLQALPPLAAALGIFTGLGASSICVGGHHKRRLLFHIAVGATMVAFAACAAVLSVPSFTALRASEGAGFEFASGLVRAASKAKSHSGAQARNVLITSGDITIAPMLVAHELLLHRSASKGILPPLWIDSEMATNSFFREFILRQTDDKRKVAAAATAAAERKALKSALAHVATQGRFNISAFLDKWLLPRKRAKVFVLSSSDFFAQRPQILERGWSVNVLGPLYEISNRLSPQVLDRHRERQKEIVCSPITSALFGDEQKQEKMSKSRKQRKLLPVLADVLAKLQGDDPAFVSQVLNNNLQGDGMKDWNSSTSPFACLRAVARALNNSNVGPEAGGDTSRGWDIDLAKLCAIGQHATFVKLQGDVQQLCQEHGGEDIVAPIFGALQELYRKLFFPSSEIVVSAFSVLSKDDAKSITGPFWHKFDNIATLAQKNPHAFAQAMKMKPPPSR